MKSFTQFVAESAPKEIVFTFGRFNPPNVSHSKLFEHVAYLAKGKTYRIYCSATRDSNKNPLLHEEKVKWMRRVFPKHARSIVEESAEDAQQICGELYAQGFNKVTLVTSMDQRIISETLLNRYNGEKLVEGFYNFRDGVRVVGIECDKSLDEKMIAAAASNDLETFNRGLPADFDLVEEYFNAVRNGLGLRESKNFRKHIQLQPVSERREAYVAGALFKVGDDVVIRESQEVGKISHCGSNYLIVESGGKKFRKWLTDIELLENCEDWVEFSPALHTLGIPRSVLPQVHAEDREGLCDYLAKAGVEYDDTTCDPKTLKPTQAEYSPSKVEKAKAFSGEDRPILASVDGHVLDGHHQWMAHLEKGTNPIRVLRFSLPISQLVQLANAYMNGSEQVRESTARQVQKPIVPRIPSLSGVSVSKLRSFKK